MKQHIILEKVIYTPERGKSYQDIVKKKSKKQYFLTKRDKTGKPCAKFFRYPAKNLTNLDSDRFQPIISGDFVSKLFFDFYKKSGGNLYSLESTIILSEQGIHASRKVLKNNKPNHYGSQTVYRRFRHKPQEKCFLKIEMYFDPENRIYHLMDFVPVRGTEELPSTPFKLRHTSQQINDFLFDQLVKLFSPLHQVFACV